MNRKWDVLLWNLSWPQWVNIITPTNSPLTTLIPICKHLIFNHIFLNDSIISQLGPATLLYNIQKQLEASMWYLRIMNYHGNRLQAQADQNWHLLSKQQRFHDLHHKHTGHIDGLVLDCCISSVLALEILQSCTKPWMFCIYNQAMEILQSCTKPSMFFIYIQFQQLYVYSIHLHCH